MRAWTLNTNLHELRGHEEEFKRRAEPDSTRDFGAENWRDRLEKQRAFADRDPVVLVVGGGHAGLSIAARLGQLGIDTLIVDRHKRIGDNWRTRYHSLTLHNEVFVNHLPYLPFPPNFPVYIPKDKLANWFEFYVEAMELNFWTGTEFVSGSYDDKRKQWSVTLKRADGTTRVMHPRHLIFATGVSSIPTFPDLPGLKDFAGPSCIPASSPMPSNGAAARRWCSAAAPAGTTWRRSSTPTAPTSLSSSAARLTWSA